MEKFNGSTNGLHMKYHITKADGSPVDGKYFVLKLDSKDPAHRSASRDAAMVYAEKIKFHLPELADDLRELVGQLEKAEQLPKLTVEALKERGIEWPEWAKYAYSMNNGCGVFSENDPFSCIEDWSFHPPADIPGKWAPDGYIERPVILPEWCKVGAWVHVYPGGFGRIDEIQGDWVKCTAEKGFLNFSFDDDVKPARVRPWTFEEAPGFIKVRSIEGGHRLALHLVFNHKTNSHVYWFGCPETLTLYGLSENYEQLDGSPCGVLEVGK